MGVSFFPHLSGLFRKSEWGWVSGELPQPTTQTNDPGGKGEAGAALAFARGRHQHSLLSPQDLPLVPSPRPESPGPALYYPL